MPKDLTRYERRFDLTGWTKPDGCPCHFATTRKRTTVMWHCPMHGFSAGPVMGPPDWPPSVTVKVTDERGNAVG